jgi:regulator of protease activity HflC (stomatin/prohibitin superfamily)
MYPVTYSSGAVTVFEYQRGLMYRRGRFERVLEPGRYRIWPFSRRHIAVVDVRRAVQQVVNQKVLTADQVGVGLNLTVGYEIADVVAAVHRVASCTGQLHEDVQLAARNLVGAVTVEGLLQERARINEDLLQAVQASAAGYGLRVLQAGIKDVILAPRVRDLLLKETEARRLAQASLIGAREEVAALRALANAARLAADNPQLLALRELDALRAFARTPGNTVVLGVPGVLPRRQGRAPARPSPSPPPPAEDA